MPSDRSWRQQRFPIAATLLLSTGAVAATALAPAPARAQVCAADSSISVDVAGDTYEICTVKVKATDEVLTKNTWYTGNSNLANEFANAVLAKLEQNPEAPWSSAWSSAINPTKPGNNPKEDGPFFLWDITGGGQQAKASAYNPNENGVNNGVNPDPDTFFWYALETRLDPVPGPLPLLGAGAAFGWSRRLRRRSRTGAEAAADSLMPLRVATSSEARL
jgi:hypothetical protein